MMGRRPNIAVCFLLAVLGMVMLTAAVVQAGSDRLKDPKGSMDSEETLRNRAKKDDGLGREEGLFVDGVRRDAKCSACLATIYELQRALVNEVRGSAIDMRSMNQRIADKKAAKAKMRMLTQGDPGGSTTGTIDEGDCRWDPYTKKKNCKPSAATSGDATDAMAVVAGDGTSETGLTVPWEVSELRAIEIMESLCPNMHDYTLVERDGRLKWQKYNHVHTVTIIGTSEIGGHRSEVRSQKLRLFCDSLVEEFDETITYSIRNMQPDLIHHMCVAETQLCTKEDLEFNARDGNSDFGLELGEGSNLSLEAPTENELEEAKRKEAEEKAAEEGKPPPKRKKKKKKKGKKKKKKKAK